MLPIPDSKFVYKCLLIGGLIYLFDFFFAEQYPYNILIQGVSWAIIIWLVIWALSKD
ncbi:MAG: putative membrane protein [Lysobacterales bacterium]|jgi:uncharacterized membrane protein